MKKILSCRCCGEKKLLAYLNLGEQPLANSYHTGETLPTYPLEVFVCQNCFHSQLSIAINPKAMFTNYLYVSGTTDTFRKHCKSLAQDAIERVMTKKIHVLDIACNDGTLLEFFRDLGCTIQGVDPAQNLRKITEKKNIPVLIDYWSGKKAKKLKKKFAIITATNVFAHVHRTDLFLKACSLALQDDGILILEFPYADKMIRYNEFDTVYHEHLSYFLVNSFSTLATRMNFHIIDVLQTSIHGGSIRFFLKKGRDPHTKKVLSLIEKEKRDGLLTLYSYKRFAKRVAENKKAFIQLLARLRKEGRKVIGYGASAKGNTMLNYFKVKLDYIVDDNELKWEFLTPGQNIPIKPPRFLQEEKESLYIPILSWNFYKGIVKKIRGLRGRKYNDYCILYVPKVKILSLYKDETSLPIA